MAVSELAQSCVHLSRQKLPGVLRANRPLASIHPPCLHSARHTEPPDRCTASCGLCDISTARGNCALRVASHTDSARLTRGW